MTSLFLVLAGTLLAAVLYSLLKPLLRPVKHLADNRDAELIAAYRAKLQQAEATLKGTELAQQRRDIEAALAAELSSANNTDSPTASHPWLMPGIIGVCLPLFAILLYIYLGNINALKPSTANTASSDIDQMVRQLEQKLATEPNDLQAWLLLGRSHQVMQNWDKAQWALTQARQLAPDNPDILLALAEVIAGANDHTLAGEPEALIAQALAIAPDSQQGRWLAGMAAWQRGDAQTAQDLWQSLLAEPGLAAETREMLQMASTQIQAISAAAEPSGDESVYRITVNVQLAAELQSFVQAEDTVFVFARAVSGPPMPLAIYRTTAAELPLTVTLDESMAMSPAMTLAASEQIIVGARISKSGNALPDSGDLQGFSSAVNPAQQPEVNIAINARVP